MSLLYYTTQSVDHMKLCPFQGSYPARLKNVFIISPPLWFKAVLSVFMNFLQEKLKERIEVVPREALPQRIPESSIPESLGGYLKVDHLAWLNKCFESYSLTLQEKGSLNGEAKNLERHGGNVSNKVGTLAFDQEAGIGIEGALTVMEFIEHMMKLQRRGIKIQYFNLKTKAVAESFQSAR